MSWPDWVFAAAELIGAYTLTWRLLHGKPVRHDEECECRSCVRARRPKKTPPPKPPAAFVQPPHRPKTSAADSLFVSDAVKAEVEKTVRYIQDSGWALDFSRYQPPGAYKPDLARYITDVMGLRHTGALSAQDAYEAIQQAAIRETSSLYTPAERKMIMDLGGSHNTLST